MMMMNSQKAVRILVLGLLAFGFSIQNAKAQNLAEGLVSHWPLDEIRGTKTPDLVSGYDMDLMNLSEENLVEGKFGMAMQFSNADQTLLSRVHEEGEDLPANQHESWTLSIWANLEGTGQNDLRIFSEGNTGDSTPLFNLGTHNGGASGQLDIFIRNSGWSTVGHIYTELEPFDEEWHHIVYVEDEGVRSVYIDGEWDFLEIPERPLEGAFPVNNTSIGGILRSSPSHWVSGILDEVAIWKRALSMDEIKEVFENGVPEVDAVEQPLFIRSFTADFPAVVKDDSVRLSWDASPDATLSINHGVGDVSAQSEFGVGEISVSLEATKTFSLTATRGTDSITSSIKISAIDGVSEGWSLIDNFDTWELGNINGKGSWKNPVGSAEVMEGAMSNVLSFLAGEGLNAIELKSRTIEEGQKATLFFRARVREEADADTIGLNIGLSEKPIRFVGDFGGNVGPFLRFGDAEGLSFYAKDGVGSEEFSLEEIDLDVAYNIWLDVENRSIEEGDVFSIHIQPDGGDRTTIADGYFSDRDTGSVDLGAVLPQLDKLFMVVNSASEADGLIHFDDFYLSNTGEFNESIPLSIGGGEVLPEVESPEIPATPSGEISVALNADGSIVITFTGTLSSSADVNGPFEPIAEASSPLTISPDEIAETQFYIAR